MEQLTSRQSVGDEEACCQRTSTISDMIIMKINDLSATNEYEWVVMAVVLKHLALIIPCEC